MGCRRFSSIPVSLPMFSMLLVVWLPLSSLSNPWLWLLENCRDELFRCGNITVGYPFSGGDRDYRCGHPHLHLECDHEYNITIIEIHGVRHQVLYVHQHNHSLTISREDVFINDFCNPQLRNPFLDSNPLELVHAPGGGYPNLTLFYDCPSSIGSPVLDFLTCEGIINLSPYKNMSVMKENISPKGCSANVTVLILQSSLDEFYNYQLSWKQALKKGFDVQWKEEYEAACGKCRDTKGACGFNWWSETICYCRFPVDSWWEAKECLPYPPSQAVPPLAENHSHEINEQPWKLIVVGAVIAGLVVGMLIMRCKQQWKKTEIYNKSRDLPQPHSSQGPFTSSSYLLQSISSNDTQYYHNDLERGNSYFGAHVFTYEELQEATDNFSPSKELGEGGFGTVYKGVLHDGCVIAVKRLFKNNFKRVDQYMNEIKILSRLHHPNLVTLYGCTSKHSRELLLVYEYIPNGTVADHLHGQQSKITLLTWPVRFRIAVETAKALAYLHTKDIIHCDVKTINILLDKQFHVKVADFGLSRLFPNNVTHVSTAPQGTPGYVDPEYRQCYQLTEKSDVYSFGVVLIEIISAKQAVDITRHQHDINLANMAICRIQNNALHELVDPSLCFENDYIVKRMITAVAELAFQCLQQDRDMRPSMEEVIEILGGIRTEDLGVKKCKSGDYESISKDDRC